MSDFENENVGEGSTVRGEGAEAETAKEESLQYGGTAVPVRRANMPDMFIALEPPDAAPYIMCSKDADPKTLVQFLSERVQAVEELRVDMRKRFAKNKSLRCSYKTGDVAYVMGRPFMLRVYPLGKVKVSGAMRGRATAKYSTRLDVSLLTLYVVHPKSFDEAKLAFMGYASEVIVKNARTMAADCCKRIGFPGEVPPVRLRAMRNKFSSFDAGCLWLSNDVVPYPPDCLVYVVWRELMNCMGMLEEQQENMLDTVLNWRNASEILSVRAKPYSNQ